MEKKNYFEFGAEMFVVSNVGLLQVRLKIPCCVYGKFMVCTGHRVQCKTPHFTKHKFPVKATHMEVQMHWA